MFFSHFGSKEVAAAAATAATTAARATAALHLHPHALLLSCSAFVLMQRPPKIYTQLFCRGWASLVHAIGISMWRLSLEESITGERCGADFEHSLGALNPQLRRQGSRLPIDCKLFAMICGSPAVLPT